MKLTTFQSQEQARRPQVKNHEQHPTLTLSRSATIDREEREDMETFFCDVHRYSDKHNCPFDYHTAARDAISKANPIVKVEKLNKT